MMMNLVKISATLACVAILLTAPASAVSFSDDFESGMGNWTQYPGSAEQLQWNDNDVFKNIVPAGGDASARQFAFVGGGNGYASYHNFGSTTDALRAEVYMFEDLTSTQDPIQGGMTLQTVNGSNAPNFSDFLRIGVLQFAGTNEFYSFRTAADGFTVTNVPRKSGWTKLGIEVDAGAGAEARFYIDDALVGTSSRVGSEFAVLTLGQNFSNFENFWYDGASVVTIPEPSSVALLCLAGLGLVAVGKRRR